eukprot:1065510-Rhodomonas_salina.1
MCEGGTIKFTNMQASVAKVAVLAARFEVFRRCTASLTAWYCLTWVGTPIGTSSCRLTTSRRLLSAPHGTYARLWASIAAILPTQVRWYKAELCLMARRDRRRVGQHRDSSRIRRKPGTNPDESAVQIERTLYCRLCTIRNLYWVRVSAYAHAVRCPVLIPCVPLQAVGNPLENSAGFD